jgi:hypothetical protein
MDNCHDIAHKSGFTNRQRIANHFVVAVELIRYLPGKGWYWFPTNSFEKVFIGKSLYEIQCSPTWELGLNSLPRNTQKQMFQTNDQETPEQPIDAKQADRDLEGLQLICKGLAMISDKMRGVSLAYARDKYLPPRDSTNDAKKQSKQVIGFTAGTQARM